MVRISMDVDVYDVSIDGWANKSQRTPSHLPSNFHHATSAPMPAPSRLPDGSRALQNDLQRLCPRESMAVAAPREKNSFHPQVPLQEEEAKRAFDERSNHQIKTTDLPLSNSGSMFRVGCCVEGRLRELIASYHLRELPSMS